MATASSAQREPSMEEILASIRRIIEDSDTGRKQPDEADGLRQDLEPAAIATPAPEVDAFRAELHAEPRKPSTLADVQAQLSAADPVIARMEMPTRSAPAPVARIEAPPVAETDGKVDAIIADWRREIAAVGEQAKAPVVRKPPVEPKVEILRDEPMAEPAFERSPSDTSRARPIAGDAPSARPAIVSEHTGRQVAAAFGELSDAFASRGKKTFDDMAEEMLRPMLQDWLDNNLPTLVERLVREEIERVARGAQ
ncbi:MAG: PopZ family protein [Mesorhizobium sp.]